MASREVPKASTKVQRMMSKTINTQRSSAVVTVKKTISSKNATDKVLRAVKDNNSTLDARPRTVLSPTSMTPKPKKKLLIQAPGSVSKSAKKGSWKRRPKPAHSGVPVPEKLKKLLEKQLQHCD